MAKKIVFTGGGIVGHVTLNLILIPKFIKDGWEVHYIGDKHGIEHEQIEKSGISKEVIAQLKTGKNITPLKITELNNYTGADGIPYFTDSQIAQIKEMQAVTGNYFDIITRPESARFKGALTPLENKAIKASGYTTAQFNAVLKDGSLA